MKIKISEATPLQIDWAVAKCEGVPVRWSAPHAQLLIEGYPYLVWQAHKDWAQGGPIVEREWLDITPWPNETREDMRWHCQQHDTANDCAQYGPTPLIAAMRCYCCSKLGDTIEVPEELI